MLMQCLSLRYRIIPVRKTPKGPMRLQGYTHFTNKLKAWRDTHNKENPNEVIHVWHHREKKPSGQAEKNEEQEEELVLPTPSMAFDNAAGDRISYPHAYSSRMPSIYRPLWGQSTNYIKRWSILGWKETGKDRLGMMANINPNRLRRRTKSWRKARKYDQDDDDHQTD